jgi:hypothetical protein
LHEGCVGVPREGERSDLLERPLVNADDYDPVVMGPLPAQSESHVEQALLDVLEEEETGAPTSTNARKCKQQKTRPGYDDGKRNIDLAAR